MPSEEPKNTPQSFSSDQRNTSKKAKNQASKKVTEARASAQRAKLDAQAEGRQQEATQETKPKESKGKNERQRLLANRRVGTTVTRAIDDYLLDHEGGNHSPKTVEWHRTALGLLQTYLEQEREITLVAEIDAPDLNAWLAYLRKSPGGHGKPRSERTIQTYARSVRAFFHWLIRRQTIESNPFDRVVFPKVGKPLIQTIEPEEFERLLVACTPPNEAGLLAERAAVRNRAILWLLYDTGIRVSELCGLKLEDFDRRHAILMVKGKGSKERRIALGANCLRNLLYYIDRHRPEEEELSIWGSAGEDHLFLSETCLPLTRNGMTQLFARLRKRAGITNKRISPHIFRHTFAIRYLVLGNDPFSLQELLRHEDMTAVKNYMHMNDETIQAQKRKYSPGDHLPTRMPGPKEKKRRGSRAKEQRKKDRREEENSEPITHH